ncbi:hypothetical protein HKX48_008089 [Thoreauomyces humboldtii]|nr:hypothetical protein HKX48_008089 [Thoreauomyces humboldtii]
MLIASRQGHVFEAELQPTDEFFKREEKYFRQLAGRQCIRFEQFPASAKKYIVFLSTATRLYQFIGQVTDVEVAGSMFTELFRAHEGQNANFQEMPGSLGRSELQFWSPFVQATGYPSVPKTFTWLTAAGLYCGDLTFGNQTSGDSVINNAQLVPYPRTVEASSPGTAAETPYATIDIPLAVNVTEFHYLMLFESSIKALSILTSDIIYEENIPLEFGEFVIGLFVDRIKSTYWVSTNLALYELIITEEDRNVWRIYLDRKAYDAALSHAKERLDLNTTSNIIASHGRTEELLYFLELMGDYEKVVTHWLQQRDWPKALGTLARQNSVSLYYKFSPGLMEHAPFETVNAWIRQPNLNSRNLIPALLRYDASRTAGEPGAEGQNQAIRYLTYVTRNLANTDTAVHNYLLSLYIAQARPNDEDVLLQFLQSHVMASL